MSSGTKYGLAIQKRRCALLMSVMNSTLQLARVSAGPVGAMATAWLPDAAGCRLAVTSGSARTAQYQSMANENWMCCAAGPSMRTWVSR